jgi:hypothetical protein
MFLRPGRLFMTFALSVVFGHLFITGFAENAVIRNGMWGPGMQVMTKPFTFDSFTGRVRELLESNGQK